MEDGESFVEKNQIRVDQAFKVLSAESINYLHIANELEKNVTAAEETEEFYHSLKLETEKGTKIWIEISSKSNGDI